MVPSLFQGDGAMTFSVGGYDVPYSNNPNVKRIQERWARQSASMPDATLIHAHISPNVGTSAVRSSLNISADESGHGSARFWLDGSIIKVNHPSVNQKQLGGGLRSVVCGFSRSSRRRLMQKLAMLDQKARPYFVTLTYPKEFPLESTQWKRHFDNWCKRLHRRYSSAGLIWRLEPQRRGAPHFHCLVYGADCSRLEFRSWCLSSWAQVVDSGDPLHQKYGADVRECNNSRQVRSYVGKYLAKVQQPTSQVNEDGECVQTVNWGAVGRWWGVRYGENLPVSKVVSTSMSRQGVYRLMRFLRRYLKGQGVRVNPNMPSMTVLVNQPMQWWANVEVLSSGKEDKWLSKAQSLEFEMGRLDQIRVNVLGNPGNKSM